MTEEPTVLDFIKALLTPWRGAPPPIPPLKQPEEPQDQPTSESIIVPSIDEEKDLFLSPEELENLPPSPIQIVPSPQPATKTLPATEVQASALEAGKEQPSAGKKKSTLPWRTFLALGLAVVAQLSMEPRQARTWKAGALLYLLAAAWLIWANLRKEWAPAELPEGEKRDEPFSIRQGVLWVGILLAMVTFYAFGGNKFTSFNVFLWLMSLAFVFTGFWLPAGKRQSGALYRHWLPRLVQFFKKPKWTVSISRWTLLLLFAAGLIIYFRVHQLDQVPHEMVSDQAEKLLDVWDVLHGESRIFFPRNTGREAFQFYLTAAIIKYFGTGFSYLSLKIGTALLGLLTLPFIYLLGKEVGNRRVGLLATIFAGIAFWPNIISRVGLRFPLYPLFVAPTLYFLLRGIRRSSRNDFILSGLFLGIGLHGYTPIRILPFVVVIAVGLYLLHRQSSGRRKHTILGLFVLAFVSLMVFLPLLRYAQENPEMFGYRTFTRLGSVERPLPGPAGEIFLKNLWRAVTMYVWDDGEIWTISVTHRPALDAISAALFIMGVVLLLVRYVRRRNWLDLFLILALPLLMMPSILSLAFPSENPAVNRAAGAMVPVFLIIGIAAEGLLTSIQSNLSTPGGRRLTWIVAFLLVGISALQNYNLVFYQFNSQYRLSAWNTSEMGQVIRDFASTVGSLDTAWVVGYPYWVDTRLVGINAGNPTRDYVMFVDQLNSTEAFPGSKLFIVNLEDQEGQFTLRLVYPKGWLQKYTSKTPNHDFYIFMVPPQ